MPTFIKTGYWDKLAKAPKGYLNLDAITGGGGGVTNITKAELDILVSSNGLTPGAYYEIEGVDVPLYGGTTIIIQAATSNKLELAGHGIFYNPKYLNSQLTPNNGYGIWESTDTYAVGQDVIWGGRHWTNTSGNVGTADDKYTLSAADWIVVPFDDVNYNVEIDIIHYDQLNDMIVRRKDRWENDVEGCYQSFIELSDPGGYALGNPIKDYQWGNYPEDFNTNDYLYIGVYSNVVKDSYFECLNFTGYYLYENKLSEYSYIFNNTYLNNSGYMFGNILEGSATIQDNTFNGINCGISYNVMNNLSTLYSNTINGNSQIYGNNLFAVSAISFNTLTNSYIDLNTLDTNSGISTNTLTDNSNIEINILQKSSMQSNTLSNGSKIRYNNILQSNIPANRINSTNIEYNSLTNQAELSFFAGGILTGKTIKNIQASSVSTITIDMSAATIIYGDYSKQLFKREDGTPRLGYYNNSDVFTVVNLNA